MLDSLNVILLLICPRRDKGAPPQQGGAWQPNNTFSWVMVGFRASRLQSNPPLSPKAPPSPPLLTVRSTETSDEERWHSLPLTSKRQKGYVYGTGSGHLKMSLLASSLDERLPAAIGSLAITAVLPCCIP